ncbi:MAG TPA: hypothetical protein VM889_03020, partial [Candidatus Thermoplasmatota archaeon]|nr:hypothetical protein [Candidatus Thermoplasmatota archaeon]
PADVGPLARVVEETPYATPSALSEATPEWADADALEAWGFRAALARTLEERPDGPLLNHVVYVFNTSAGAAGAFEALDGLFRADPWKPVSGGPPIGDASAIYRLDTRGGSGFVLVLREASVVAQALAVGETMTEARLVAWGKTLSSRAQ